MKERKKRVLIDTSFLGTLTMGQMDFAWYVLYT